MNDDEWRRFLAELFTAFPGMKDYIESRSDNPKGTTNTWRTTLDGISYKEAIGVLHDWLSGRREPPKAYERDYIAITIRSCVAYNRLKQREAEESRRRADEKAMAQQRRAALTGLGVDAAYHLCLSLNRRLAAGEITEQQRLAEIDKICKMLA